MATFPSRLYSVLGWWKIINQRGKSWETTDSNGIVYHVRNSNRDWPRWVFCAAKYNSTTLPRLRLAQDKIRGKSPRGGYTPTSRKTGGERRTRPVFCRIRYETVPGAQSLSEASGPTSKIEQVEGVENFFDAVLHWLYNNAKKVRLFSNLPRLKRHNQWHWRHWW